MTAEPFNGQAPHVEGSDTSEGAARSIEGQKLTLRDRVHQALIDAREGSVSGLPGGTYRYGLTDDEIEVLTRLKHQTASARRRELVLLGLVVDSGHRRPTRSGRPATVWRAVAPHEQVQLFGPNQVDVIRDKVRARLRHCDRDQLDAVWQVLNDQGVKK